MRGSWKWVAAVGCGLGLVMAADRLRPAAVLADDQSSERSADDAADRLDRIVEKLGRLVDRMAAGGPPPGMPPRDGGPPEHGRGHRDHGRPSRGGPPPGGPGSWSRMSPEARERLERRLEELPPEVRERVERRMEEGRERMEKAREKFRELESRVAALEAEVRRLRAGE